MKKLVFGNLQDKRQQQEPNYKLGDLVHTVETKRVFRKGESINWSYILSIMIQIFHDTFASCIINYLPERYNKNLLIPTKFILDENKQAMKKLKLFQ